MFARGLEEPAKVLPVDIAHHVAEFVLDLRNLGHLHDVGVMKQGRDLGLVAKQPDELVVERQVWEYALDDDVGIGFGRLENACQM